MSVDSSPKTSLLFSKSVVSPSVFSVFAVSASLRYSEQIIFETAFTPFNVQSMLLYASGEIITRERIKASTLFLLLYFTSFLSAKMNMNTAKHIEKAANMVLQFVRHIAIKSITAATARTVLSHIFFAAKNLFAARVIPRKAQQAPVFACASAILSLNIPSSCQNTAAFRVLPKNLISIDRCTSAAYIPTADTKVITPKNTPVKTLKTACLFFLSN